MQSALSDRFENRIINLEEYAFPDHGSAHKEAGPVDPTDPTALQDLMTVRDIKRVDQLGVYAKFVVDQLYPRIRTSSDESSYFSYDLHHTHSNPGKDQEVGQDP